MEKDKTNDNIVYITSDVNEIFASTEVTQYFTNELENPIELKILFPINKKLSLSKFIVSMDEKNIISKVMSKEKAEEKYVDTIASGNVGFKSSYEDENKSYSVNIGNLAPKKQVKLQTNFIQMVDNKDLSYEFNIIENYPAFYYDGAKINFSENNNKKLETKIKIETQSKITRLIPMYVNDEIKKNSEYNVKYSPDYKKAEIEYKNNKPNLFMIKKCCSSINNAIKSFKLLSNDYKNVYELLEKRYTDDKILIKSGDDIESEKINKIEMNLIEKDKNFKEKLLVNDNIEIDKNEQENNKDWWKLFF